MYFKYEDEIDPRRIVLYRENMRKLQNLSSRKKKYACCVIEISRTKTKLYVVAL